MNICALIPAYNEENTVGHVISVLHNIKEVNSIIVINDGSEDSTSERARQVGARVIDLPENLGKGAALKQGLESCSADIILMLDADLIGLKTEHVYSLIDPVIQDEYDMTVGIFDEGRSMTDMAQKINPHLSGQRAIKADILGKIKNIDKAGYGVEVTINRYFKKNGRMKRVELPSLTHATKEEKRGLLKGLVARFKMYGEVLKTIFLFIFD